MPEMKKIAAILLITLLAVNLFGYRFIIATLERKADTSIENAIDNKDYNESDLIEIKIALQMPYQERYTDFERHYGEVIIDGRLYSYVERKIAGDELILKCLPNTSKQQLKKAADDIAKSNNGQDIENNGKKQSATQHKIFKADLDDKNQFNLLPDDYASILSSRWYIASLSDVMIQKPHQPPKC
jgi:hypothetical protein